jgi:hypothetical protein
MHGNLQQATRSTFANVRTQKESRWARVGGTLVLVEACERDGRRIRSSERGTCCTGLAAIALKAEAAKEHKVRTGLGALRDSIIAPIETERPD